MIEDPPTYTPQTVRPPWRLRLTRLQSGEPGQRFDLGTFEERQFGPEGIPLPVFPDHLHAFTVPEPAGEGLAGRATRALWKLDRAKMRWSRWHSMPRSSSQRETPSRLGIRSLEATIRRCPMAAFPRFPGSKGLPGTPSPAGSRRQPKCVVDSITEGSLGFAAKELQADEIRHVHGQQEDAELGLRGDVPSLVESERRQFTS